MNEPIADAVRGILDGHVVLDRASSPTATTTRRSTCCRAVSRVAPAIQTPRRRAPRRDGCARCSRRTARSEDLIAIGAYQPGSDARTDYAIDHVHALDAFLRQPPDRPEQAEIAERRLAAMLADSADAFGEAA